MSAATQCEVIGSRTWTFHFSGSLRSPLPTSETTSLEFRAEMFNSAKTEEIFEGGKWGTHLKGLP